jgi:hypothetical protein
MEKTVFNNSSNLRAFGIGKRSEKQRQKDWFKNKYGASWKSYYNAWLAKEAANAEDKYSTGDDTIDNGTPSPTNPGSNPLAAIKGYMSQSNMLVGGLIVIVLIAAVWWYKKRK